MKFASTLTPVGGHLPSIDLVSRDHAALAAHMIRCTRSRGTWFKLRRYVDAGQAALASRLVTVAFVGTVVATSAALLFA